MITPLRTSKAALAAVTVSIAGALTSGCVSILPEPAPAPRLFTIATGALPVLQTLPIVISVARPATSQALSGRDIPWRRGVEFAYVDDASWESVAPDLLHRLLLDAVMLQQAARAVVRVADGALADYELRWDVLRFEVVEDQPNKQVAVFEAVARVLGAKSRTVLSETRVYETSPLQARSATAAAEALGAVANAGAARIGVFAHRVIGADLGAQPSAASTSR